MFWDILTTKLWNFEKYSSRGPRFQTMILQIWDYHFFGATRFAQESTSMNSYEILNEKFNVWYSLLLNRVLVGLSVTKKYAFNSYFVPWIESRIWKI